MKRTQEEINRQLEGLREERGKLPEFSMFGDHNWERIDAQIDVLEGGDPEQYYMDEDEDDYEDGDNDIYWAAVEADDWLQGSTNQDLFSN